MNGEQRLNEDQKFALKIGLCGIAVIGLIALASGSQTNNQVVRPFPNAAPAPVVPDIPDLIAELSRARTIGEGRARAAIELLSARRDRARLFQARRLYEDAQAEFNGAIDHLRSGLGRRFIDADVPRIAARVLEGKRKVDRFAGWVNDLSGPVIGAGPLDSMTEILQGWFDRVGRENAQAIEQLRADLDRCRLGEWDQL